MPEFQDPTVASWTPINMWAMLRALINNRCPLLTNNGAPVSGTSGTFAGQAGKGTLLIDFSSGNFYINTGTIDSPSWIRFEASGVSPALDGVTANPGGGQAGAVSLTAAVNRVTTAASRGDSVALPAATPGTTIIVINAGAQPISVFPVSGDKINGQAVNLPVTVIPNETVVFASSIVNQWYGEVGVGVSGSIPTDIFRDNIVSGSGGGQGAFQLDAELNRITTVNSDGSVKLPVSVAGMGITVINRGLNPCQIFGSGTDTIDGIAASTGVSQMANSVVLYFCTTAGIWESEGLSTGFEPTLGLQTLKFADNITATVGGGQLGAFPLTSLINRVATVASQGNSVKLPTATPGLKITVINSGNNAMQVFGSGSDTINGISTAVGVSQGIGTTAVYVCTAAGNWIVPISQLWSSTPLAIGTSSFTVPPNVPHAYVFNRLIGEVTASIAAPTSGAGFDGNPIQFTSDSPFSHTITFVGGILDSGSIANSTLTFNAFKGASALIMAFNGRWKLLSSVGVVAS